jgi:glycosyltransferase involved in cell wall biosynthesis
MNTRDIKILVLADPASIHANRFVNLLKDIGYRIRMFRSDFYYTFEEHLHDTLIYVALPGLEPSRGLRMYVCWPMVMDCFRWNWFYKTLCRLFKQSPRNRPREIDLVKVIRKWNPQIIFSLKMQNEGYTVAKTREIMGKHFTPQWVHFNWGTDIEYFGKHSDHLQEHLPKIKSVLEQCDFHLADCHRDARQAVEYGLRGVQLGTCLANGGFDLKILRDIGKAADQNRKVIVIKGRQGGYVGKAFHILKALRNVSRNLLKNYKIRIIMATPDVKGAAEFLAYLDGLDYKVLPKLNYHYLLGLFASSRLALSATDVDGTPGFLIEAMAMGAFPIHSDMESIREWITHGENGLLFPVDDINALTRCIIRALTDDSLVESARHTNRQITMERMDRHKIRAFIKDTIEQKILRT